MYFGGFGLAAEFGWVWARLGAFGWVWLLDLAGFGWNGCTWVGLREFG